MSDYISREAFIESQRHLYCDNCAKRKGMKRGKMRFVYEIGDAPCRACGYGDVLDDLEDFPAADVWPNKTNGDMIRRMDNRNLAEWISSKFCPPSQKKQLFRQAWLDWLNKEVGK